MQQHFVSVGPEERIGDAREVMRLARARHLLVLDAGALVGLVSYRDLLEASLAAVLDGTAVREPGSAEDEPVSAHMLVGPVTIAPAATLEEAARCMLRLRLGCLPVVERRAGPPRPVGILAESDLLRAAYVSRPAAS